MSKSSPNYQYDCMNCRFNWCCGPTCYCLFSKLSRPPRERQEEIDQAVLEWEKERKRVQEKEETYNGSK